MLLIGIVHDQSSYRGTTRTTTAGLALGRVRAEKPVDTGQPAHNEIGPHVSGSDDD